MLHTASLKCHRSPSRTDPLAAPQSLLRSSRMACTRCFHPHCEGAALLWLCRAAAACIWCSIVVPPDQDIACLACHFHSETHNCKAHQTAHQEGFQPSLGSGVLLLGAGSRWIGVHPMLGQGGPVRMIAPALQPFVVLQSCVSRFCLGSRGRRPGARQRRPVGQCLRRRHPGPRATGETAAESACGRWLCRVLGC